MSDFPWGWAPQLGYGILPDGTRVDSEGMITYFEQALAHERGLREAAEAALEATASTIRSLDAGLTRAEIEREAAEAERTDAYVLVSKRVLEIAVLTNYASRLLAALVAQRQALEGIAVTSNGRRIGLTAADAYSMRALAGETLKQTDTAALEAEGETLGVTP